MGCDFRMELSSLCFTLNFLPGAGEDGVGGVDGGVLLSLVVSRSEDVLS